jgi:hypothetical protein
VKSVEIYDARRFNNGNQQDQIEQKKLNFKKKATSQVFTSDNSKKKLLSSGIRSKRIGNIVPTSEKDRDIKKLMDLTEKVELLQTEA